MNILRPIFWKEGSPLEPHHFQLTEARCRRELQWVMGAVSPWPWGFSSLALSEEALERGALEIAGMDLALPGGHRITAPGNASIPAALLPEAPAGALELTAYLAFPLASHVGPNVRCPPWEDPGPDEAAAREAPAPEGRSLPQDGALPRPAERYPGVQAGARAGDPEARAAPGFEADLAGEAFPEPGRAGLPDVAPAGGLLPSGPSLSPRASFFAACPEPVPVPDMQADGPVAWVDTLTYSGEIMFGPRDADARGRLLIPVARFRKEGGRLARLPFAPPALRLYPEGGLRETVMDVLELLRAKGRELEDYKLSLGRDRGPASDSRERALAAALGIVVRHVARLNGLLNASCAHPCAAYAALSELASELSPFGPEGAGTALAPYDHGDPGPCFLAARDSVARSLEALSPGPELSLPFRRDGESFSCEIPPGSDPALSFFIAARSEARAEEFKQSMPLKARLASPARLAELVAWGLPGVGLTPVREAPAGLPRRPDAAYFSVRKQDPLWEEAFASGRIEIRWSGAPEKVQLLLVGVRQ